MAAAVLAAGFDAGAAIKVLRTRGKRAVIPADRAARLMGVKAVRLAGYLTAERYFGVGV